MASRRARSTADSRSHNSSKLPHHLVSSRYLFFGGKGGVGKTTAATATAIFLLSQSKSEDILLFSTDPAHSLADSLSKSVGNRLVKVRTNGRAALYAFEMDSGTALEEFRSQHGKILAEIAERGTFLDEADINELLNLSLPGLDEVMALFELSELDRSARYKHIVIDTAPSGHTSRLLRLPEVFTRMVGALDRMSDKHRYIMAQFARRRVVADEVDLFLRDLSERIERVRSLLFDPSQSSFALVSIPESMSVSETERYYESLKADGIPVRDLIINKVEETHGRCGFCKARVETQKPWIDKLSKLSKELTIHLVPLYPHDVRGFKDLELIGERIWTSAKHRKSPTPRAKPERKKAPLGVSDFPLGQRRISIFGGKGGVGKTTAAAAYSLSLAKKQPSKRVLLFSTDPAHSLSDSLAEEIGPHKKKVAGIANLDAMEIDPGEWFAQLKQKYRTWIDDLFESLSRSSKLEIKFDREAMRELVELAPPGIDEIAALGRISELVDEQLYDFIVLDTAPTGHLVRFLELPQIALSWVRTFIKLLLKYQHIVHAPHIAEELVALSKSIKRVLALLTDPKECEFVGVAIPEYMSLEETLDLAKALKKLEIPMQAILVNNVITSEAADGCEFCEARRKEQQLVVQALSRKLESSIRIFIAPQQGLEIRGPKSLGMHFNNWHLVESKRNAPKKLRARVGALKNGSKSKLTNGRKRKQKIATG